jgi:CRISPR/Cas system endoribonuclease Cas6 (RAMP superfamily)
VQIDVIEVATAATATATATASTPTSITATAAAAAATAFRIDAHTTTIINSRTIFRQKIRQLFPYPTNIFHHLVPKKRPERILHHKLTPLGS